MYYFEFHLQNICETLSYMDHQEILCFLGAVWEMIDSTDLLIRATRMHKSTPKSINIAYSQMI